jgi:hypothetical protein
MYSIQSVHKRPFPQQSFGNSGNSECFILAMLKLMFFAVLLRKLALHFISQSHCLDHLPPIFKSSSQLGLSALKSTLTVCPIAIFMDIDSCHVVCLISIDYLSLIDYARKYHTFEYRHIFTDTNFPIPSGKTQ